MGRAVRAGGGRGAREAGVRGVAGDPREVARCRHANKHAAARVSRVVYLATGQRHVYPGQELRLVSLTA
jgi:hypothetical protein